MLYLDNAATTKIHPKVNEAMRPYLEQYFGNPNSLYYPEAIVAKQAVQEARESCSRLLGTAVDEIIFTSSGSESNNMILKGVAFSNLNKKKIITSRVEHSSVVESLEFLKRFGFEICYVKLTKDGNIDIQHLESLLDDTVALVTIMFVNNEMGTIFDIEKIANLCHMMDVPFHSDVTQAIGKIGFSFNTVKGLTFATCSGHKFYGPKGVGIAIIDQKWQSTIIPLIHGGEQENSLRGGTHAVHQIVGIGEAAKITFLNLEKNISKLAKDEIVLVDRLKTVFKESIIFNNLEYNKIPGIINFRIQGMNNQVLLNAMSKIISASSGSACSVSKPSYVLEAYGLSPKEISESIRFSLSAYDDYEGFVSIE